MANLWTPEMPGLPDLSGLDLSEDEMKNGPKDTLLVCGECSTIEHASGPPEYNEELEALGCRHEVYVSGNLYRHPLALTTVNAQLWEKSEDFRKFITAMIQDATKTGDTGLGTKNYELQETFRDDAIACWRKHNRTTDCGDYRTDKMKLLPDTRGERLDLGMSVKAKDRPGVYLCRWCPVESVIQSRINKDKF